MPDPQRLTIAQLTHDLQKERSIALITWDNFEDKRLGVVVPFNTKIADLLPAIQAALADLRKELEFAEVKMIS